MRKITALVTETFKNKVEKENAEILMDAIFPKGGEVVTSGVVKGEVGLKGWRIVPKKWWVIRCKTTKNQYLIKFEIIETAMGDIHYFWSGTTYKNLLFILDKALAVKRIEEFIESGMLTNLIVK